MGSFDDILKEKQKEVDEYENTSNNTDEIVEVVPITENVTEKKYPVKKTSDKYLDRVKNKMKNQKKKIKQDYPEETEIELDQDDREHIKKNLLKRIHVNRKEKKRITGQEHNQLLDTQKLVMAFAFIGMMFLFMMWQYNPGSQAITTIVFIVGGFLFIPLGAIMGWVFLDPYMRCKIMRKMSKGRKNFGIINFVGKGKKIVSRIKNFDEDLIWIKNKCWALTKSGIYEIDKNGEQVTDNRVLDPDSFVTLTETVPTMFIDIDSMQPLTFETSGREGISPEELGSALKGWVDNQMAKIMFLKKTLDAYFLIVILCSIASAFLAYQNNEKIAELEVMVEKLTRQIQQLI